jgi:putative FmdB family regulatory protein
MGDAVLPAPLVRDRSDDVPEIHGQCRKGGLSVVFESQCRRSFLPDSPSSVLDSTLEATDCFTQVRIEGNDDMRLYDFLCRRCSKHFEELVSGDDEIPDCPVCARRDDVAREPFSGVRVGKKTSAWPPPDIKVPWRRK